MLIFLMHLFALWWHWQRVSSETYIFFKNYYIKQKLWKESINDARRSKRKIHCSIS